MRFGWAAAAALFCGVATTAAAQEDYSLAIRWIGEVEQPGGEPSRYRVRADINLDRRQRYVATVRYAALNCVGVWTRPEQAGAHWRFEEVITDDPDGRCVAQMDVELVRAGDGLLARWREPGRDAVVATARLRPWIWPTSITPESPVPDRE